jgi:hypothetical protein
MILFLDIDGVLHPEILRGKNTLFGRLPLVEEVLREYPAVDIVISSAWRLKHTLAELRSNFSPDIAARIVGVTPDHRKLCDKDSPESLTRFSRHWECDSWIRTNRYSFTRWMALDDRDYLFRPFTDNLMVLDRLEAFIKDHQDTFRAYLVALTQDTQWPSYHIAS